MCAALGVHPLSAWIGTPDRRLGWWALFAGQNSANLGRTVARAGTVGCPVLGVTAALEGAGWWFVDSGSARLGGAMGSPAYLGAAATLVLPLAIGQVFDGARIPMVALPRRPKRGRGASWAGSHGVCPCLGSERRRGRRGGGRGR